MMPMSPFPPMAFATYSPARRPPATLSDATWLTTFAPCAAMSAVKTGMFAAFAFSMAGAIPLVSVGQTMIASTPWTRKLSIADCCFARSKSPVVMISRYPFFAASSRSPPSSWR